MTFMTRRQFTMAGMTSLLAATVGTQTASGVEVPNLEQTLRAGLKPRTPAEDEFLALVVFRVNEGTLPLALVHKVFLWARRQSTQKAFTYFEVGLRRLAARDGIRI